MPTKVVKSDTTPQQVFTVPADKIGKITFIEVDNRSASDITITIQDVFTPSPTDETPITTEHTENRKILTVRAGDDISWSDKNNSLQILGACVVVADVSSTDCDITVGYILE